MVHMDPAGAESTALEVADWTAQRVLHTRLAVLDWLLLP